MFGFSWLQTWKKMQRPLEFFGFENLKERKLCSISSSFRMFQLLRSWRSCGRLGQKYPRLPEVWRHHDTQTDGNGLFGTFVDWMFFCVWADLSVYSVQKHCQRGGLHSHHASPSSASLRVRVFYTNLVANFIRIHIADITVDCLAGCKDTAPKMEKTWGNLSQNEIFNYSILSNIWIFETKLVSIHLAEDRKRIDEAWRIGVRVEIQIVSRCRVQSCIFKILKILEDISGLFSIKGCL